MVAQSLWPPFRTPAANIAIGRSMRKVSKNRRALAIAPNIPENRSLLVSVLQSICAFKGVVKGATVVQNTEEKRPLGDKSTMISQRLFSHFRHPRARGDPGFPID
jgi:hypothetical protein